MQNINNIDSRNALVSSEDILIQELYNHGSYKAREKNKYSCLFCSSSDALGLYESKDGKWKYKCFSCGESGDVINLVMEKEQISFPEALKVLCERYSLPFTDDDGRKLAPSRVNKGKVIEFFKDQQQQAYQEHDLNEAYRLETKIEEQQEASYYFQFPYVDDKGNPKKEWENIEALLTAKGIIPAYNVITKEIEILGTRATRYDNQLMDIHSLCVKNGLNVSINFLPKAINRIAEENEFNPVTEWLEECEKKYDKNKGQYIKELCETLIVDESFPIELRDIMVTKWLLNTVNIAYNEGYSNTEGCLVLQGKQRCGKTSWIKELVPRKFLKTGLDLDPGNTDSMRKSLCNWVVELGELDSTTKNEQGKLKAFFTESVDTYRIPYAISPAKYNRTTSFYGTVNRSDFLRDETGNRRYWVIPVKEVDLDKLRTLDIELIWGEAKVLLAENGNNLALTREELEMVNENNEQFTVKGETQIKVETMFSWEANKDSWVFMSSSEIAHQLGLKSTGGLKTALEKMGAEVTRKRVNGKNLRGYLVPPFIRID